jgi:hypothetical protein
MQPDGPVISWEEFRTAFRAHHIPEGLIERKLNEFLALTQGTHMVLQYAQTFNHLCQYARYHADNDAKKQERFHHGLNTKLKERLNLVKANTFSELVNMALTQEDCITAHRAEKKRKTPHWTLECSITEVSSCSECVIQSTEAKCSTWQIGFPPASTARRV